MKSINVTVINKIAILFQVALIFLLIPVITPLCHAQDVVGIVGAEAEVSSVTRIDTNAIYVRDLLFEMEEKLDVFFNFDDDLIRGKVLNDKPALPENIWELEVYLDALLGRYDLTFDKLDNSHFVILKSRVNINYSMPVKPFQRSASLEMNLATWGNLMVQQEEQTVSGTVTDISGEPLIGVSIIVQGTNIGTTTNSSGQFTIRFSNDHNILVFSYLGFVSKEIQVDGRTTLEVTLSERIILGDELVVVGYGTQQRRDLTGSIGSVSSDQIANLPYLSVEQTLQGRLAGVQTSPASGKPGDYVAVRIRGIGTVNQSDPLYVIDGFPVSGGISAINVDDIESIDVLKDASAAAIYGSRGANGVVIITTKRGHRDRIEVDVNMYTGVQEVTSPPRMLNASQYAAMNNEARTNAGEPINPAFSDPTALADSADWIDAIFRRAPMQNYSASIRGGNENLRYNLSGGLTRQDGVIISSGFERKSFRLNLDSDVMEWLEVGNSLSYSLSQFQNEGGGHLVGMAMNNLPTQPVYRNGEFSGPEGIAAFDGDEENPVGLAAINNHSEDKHRVLNNFFAVMEPVDGLRFRSEFGLDLAFERIRNWSQRYQWGVKQNPESHLFEGSFERVDWLWDNTLTYDMNIDAHRITLLTGVSVQSSHNKFIGATGQEFVSDIANQLDNIQSNQSVFGSTTQHGLLSYMGRVNYDYQSRYLLTATARYDGSSRFGENYRYGFFPSASAAWRVSNESFFPNWTFLDDLKIRAGYGVTGNQEAIPAFGYVALLNPTYRYTFGNETVPAVVPENYPNQSLRWEQVIQSNIAVDLILFNGRLDVTAEYYIRDTEDMLLTSPIPITSGFYDFGHPMLNVGAIRNKGYEFSVNTTSEVGGINWLSNFNISFNENEILRLSGIDGDDPIPGGEVAFGRFATRLEVGQPIGSFYGFVTDGIFQNQDQVDEHAVQTPGTNPATSTAPGDIRFKDLNGDGVINDDDRTFIGNPNPDFFFGWNNDFYYRNFDLSVFVQGTYGNDILNVNRMRGEHMAVARNQWATTLDRWNGEGTSNSIPRATTNDPNDNSRVSDRYVEDGSYIRIKNITLGYSLPVSMLERIGFRQLRIYGSVQNLYTITNYTGFDPEVGLSGLDNSVYPQSRIITTGINIGF